jgi:hypothetical protein
LQNSCFRRIFGLFLFLKVNLLRAYTVATTAVTLGVSKKWVDNVLSHHRVPGVLQQKQGIARRVTPAGLLALEIGVCLGRAFAIPIAQALEIANQLMEAKGDTIQLPSIPSIRVVADIETITSELNTRLERAVEMTPNPKRGRPRRK